MKSPTRKYGTENRPRRSLITGTPFRTALGGVVKIVYPGYDNGVKPDSHSRSCSCLTRRTFT
jgi:hypothetical protein